VVVSLQTCPYLPKEDLNVYRVKELLHSGGCTLPLGIHLYYLYGTCTTERHSFSNNVTVLVEHFIYKLMYTVLFVLQSVHL